MGFAAANHMAFAMARSAGVSLNSCDKESSTYRACVETYKTPFIALIGDFLYSVIIYIEVEPRAQAQDSICTFFLLRYLLECGYYRMRR